MKARIPTSFPMAQGQGEITKSDEAEIDRLVKDDAPKFCESLQGQLADRFESVTQDVARMLIESSPN